MRDSTRQLEEVLDSTMTAALADKIFSAYAIEVMVSGSVSVSMTGGCNDPFSAKEATGKEILFDLASLTKPVVAFVVYTLLQELELAPDTVVSATMKIPSELEIGSITIEELVEHTSGLPPSFDIFTTGEWQQGEEAILAKLYSVHNSEQRGRYVYSCLGYVLLGKILEQLSSLSLDELIPKTVKEVFGDVGIMYNPRAQGLASECARTSLERPRRGILHPGVVHDGTAFALGGVAGNAGLFSSAGDYMRMVRAIVRELRSGAGITSYYYAALLRALERAPPCKVGWILSTGQHRPISSLWDRFSFGHTGYTGTSVLVDVPRDWVCVCLTNRTVYYDTPDSHAKYVAFRDKIYDAIAYHVSRLSA